MNNDSSNLIDIPFFDLQVFVNNVANVEPVTEEALKAFFVACQEHSKGIEKELEFLGRKTKSHSSSALEMTFDTSNSKSAFVFDQMIANGDNSVELIPLENI